MPAYLIASVDVTDAVRYGEYMKVSPELIERGGRRPVHRCRGHLSLNESPGCAPSAAAS